ncbi:glycosyltransferase [Comamonas endophytica]|uniref:Glycosyltransferase n=1 Tax=Comamonas endophytica TaxID=2949090 RepID=A0ABY6GFB8_9BURK|nr:MULTISPECIES: glycosyltransferase [unclassified Acidovorax]MCD2513431.1 glycosyltransferase [Acidovorax sp. D4N7]UYG53787.1 glycosyltransferase [Acidovorax sp. 5MLIR]
MIGVVIPAHNEEQHLQACLLSVRKSVQHLARQGLSARIMVVLDACTDGSAHIARALADQVLEITQRNVGEARRAGAQWLLEQGSEWIACTDADTQVPENWLYAQWACQADVFCGIVRVEDWGDYSPEVVRAFHASVPQDGHPHIHGANMGLSREAYLQSGGFLPAAAHEDVSLIRRCELAGLRIARRIEPCVVTSARRDARAREGFGDFLLKLERSVNAAPAHAGAALG